MTAATILIVDDNPLNLELVTDILQSAGYRIRQARNGEEALDAARGEAPSLILLDIGLPGKDGYAVVGELKADPGTRGIPTVALTAFAMHGDEERAYRAGFDGYITKPLNTRALTQMVTRLLQGGTGP